MSGGFLARWSRRKLAAAVQSGAASPVVGDVPAQLRPDGADPLPLTPATPEGAAQAAAVPGAAPQVSLPPVESLSLSSDFTAFLKEEVSESLRRKALQKLFSDPHFNRMDGLDIYIDDYSQPDPIPPEILAKLQHAREWLMDDAVAPPAPEEAKKPVEAAPVDAECGQAATAAEAVSVDRVSPQAATAPGWRCGDELSGAASPGPPQESGQNAP